MSFTQRLIVNPDFGWSNRLRLPEYRQIELYTKRKALNFLDPPPPDEAPMDRIAAVARAKLLILDDWGPEALTPEQARDLLEIIEDRYDKGSLIITSQVPVDRWHDMIGIPTLADAILDRVIHNAYRIDLTGESLRKTRSSA